MVDSIEEARAIKRHVLRETENTKQRRRRKEREKRKKVEKLIVGVGVEWNKNEPPCVNAAPFPSIDT